MLVLHGFWSTDGGLGLWAEDSDRRVKSLSQAVRSARPHPFAASTGVLAGICAGKPGEATLLLPSLPMAPLDSPELVRTMPRPPATPGDAALCALVDAAARMMLPHGLDLTPVRRGRRPKRLPAVEGWLAALSTPDGRFDADSAELDALAHALQPWDEFAIGQTGPVRATFRLTEVEPNAIEPAASAWRLEFLLQSTEDPSLLVPAARVWADDA